MKLLAPLVQKLDANAIMSLRQGKSLELSLPDGSNYALTADDVIVQRTEKPGMSVANEGDITVALDTRLNDALIQEGWAREIVSKLQNLRKELKFDVSDRIHVTYSGPSEVSSAIIAQKEYIAAETLALSIEPGESADMHEVELNGITARFAIVKA